MGMDGGLFCNGFDDLHGGGLFTHIVWGETSDPTGERKLKMGRRSETREAVNRYHSVELNFGNLQMAYQFKIWNISPKGMCILLREDSVVMKHVQVGDVWEMKFYRADSPRMSEHLRTRIQHITRDDQGRFKGHYLVGLSIVEKHDADEPPPHD
jgi:hypothetical protein